MLQHIRIKKKHGRLHFEIITRGLLFATRGDTPMWKDAQMSLDVLSDELSRIGTVPGRLRTRLNCKTLVASFIRS